RDADRDPPIVPLGDGAIALRTDGSRRVAAVRTADCVPLLVAERSGHAVAAVHAGWRGTAAGIATRCVSRLSRAGVRPRRLVAAIGPAVRACCYEVSADVVAVVSRASGVDAARVSHDGIRGRPMLDLAGAVAAQLVSAGIAAEAVSVAPWCTACSEELFFSYRRDGATAGRMMAVIGWRSDCGASSGTVA
ncbi:MAG TPA: polyphenol oxidase family protein, partial [Candidatus Polarisedimenticolaceae bacterium]|nr:polyphenol oxidase family protein [Candidatus Polarisedimenticolaceae bacterium]